MGSAHTNQPSAARCPQCGAGVPPNAAGYTVCQYCGSSLVWSRQGVDTGKAQDAVVRGMRLKPFVYTDAQGTGLEVFHMLVPVGWQFQGGCRWLLDNPRMPAVVAFQVANPRVPNCLRSCPTSTLLASRFGVSQGLDAPVGHVTGPNRGSPDRSVLLCPRI
mgnify:CR=1 FL=1